MVKGTSVNVTEQVLPTYSISNLTTSFNIIAIN